MRIIYNKFYSLMNKLYITFLLIFISFNFSTHAKAEDTVVLGVDCDNLVLFEYFQNMDPMDSDFIKRVTSGDCRGTHYSEPVPRSYAEIFVNADPVNSFFIQGESGIHDGGTLDPITVIGEPGNNEFSIPWYWSNNDNSDLKDQISNPSNPQFCSPDESNNYQQFTEVS